MRNKTNSDAFTVYNIDFWYSRMHIAVVSTGQGLRTRA